MNNSDFAFTSGLIAIGGYTVREVFPFLKNISEQFKDWEYLCLDSLFGNGVPKTPTFVSLLVDDSILDPRAPFNSRSALFNELLSVQHHYPLVIVAPVTYRNFCIGGEESVNLHHRLGRMFRQLRFGIECRSGSVAYVYDFATRVPANWTIEDTYNDDEEWFRACGDCKCVACGKTYQEHPSRSIFHELCNGQLVKL